MHLSVRSLTGWLIKDATILALSVGNAQRAENPIMQAASHCLVSFALLSFSRFTTRNHRFPLCLGLDIMWSLAKRDVIMRCVKSAATSVEEGILVVGRKQAM